MYNARRRGESPGEYDFADPEQVVLTPLPCWAHLDPAHYAARVSEMVRDIEEETIARHQHDETAPTGAMFVLQQDPHARPRRTKRSPAPLFPTFRATVYDALYEAYTWFVVAYREAAELLAGGALDVQFPRGSLPPALPFVPA